MNMCFGSISCFLRTSSAASNIIPTAFFALDRSYPIDLVASMRMSVLVSFISVSFILLTLRWLRCSISSYSSFTSTFSLHSIFLATSRHISEQSCSFLISLSDYALSFCMSCCRCSLESFSVWYTSAALSTSCFLILNSSRSSMNRIRPYEPLLPYRLVLPLI